jgi:hypothetical protein
VPEQSLQLSRGAEFTSPGGLTNARERPRHAKGGPTGRPSLHAWRVRLPVTENVRIEPMPGGPPGGDGGPVIVAVADQLPDPVIPANRPLAPRTVHVPLPDSSLPRLPLSIDPPRTNVSPDGAVNWIVNCVRPLG